MERSDRARFREPESFRRVEEERRRQVEANRARAALAIELCVSDMQTLDALLGTGIRRESLAAVEWIPLVLVAWADGVIQPGERDSILRAARHDGLAPNHPAHALLSVWLDEKPPGGLLDAWTRYVQVMTAREDDGARRARQERMRERLRDVAEADGGWFDFGSSSREESALIEAMTRAFGGR